jgi:hypothetical protein
MQITMDGKYLTRDGRKTRVLAIDRVCVAPMQKVPVVGLYKTDDGSEMLTCWTAEGYYGTPIGFINSKLDLVPVPDRKPVVHQMWAVMKDGSDEIKYSSYCEQDAEWHCNVFLHETVRLIQWNT